MLRENIRDGLTVQEMQKKIVGDIKLTPAEVRNYFSKLPQDSIPFVPTQVEVQIITREPKIKEEEIERVKKELRDRSFLTLYYLGVSHYGDNWFYGAYDNLKEAYQKNPMDVNVLYYLAKASARTSWKKEGVEYMEEAFRIAVPSDSMMVRLYDGLVTISKNM